MSAVSRFRNVEMIRGDLVGFGAGSGIWRKIEDGLSEGDLSPAEKKDWE